jgi:hypothetical protein
MKNTKKTKKTKRTINGTIQIGFKLNPKGFDSDQDAIYGMLELLKYHIEIDWKIASIKPHLETLKLS